MKLHQPQRLDRIIIIARKKLPRNIFMVWYDDLAFQLRTNIYVTKEDLDKLEQSLIAELLKL